MYGYVYLTTNLINGKLYIGKKVASKFIDSYKGSGTLLKLDFQKYGKENFKTEIIEQCDDKDTLTTREQFWIRFYDAVNDPNYNNLTDGKVGVGYGKCTSEIKSKISKGNSGKIRSQEIKDKLSKDRKGLILINNGASHLRIKPEELNNYLSDGWVKGHLPGRINGPKSEEAKLKNSLAHKGKSHSGDWNKNQKESFKNKKYHWYTDGVNNLLISELNNDPVPEGFYPGKTYSKDMGRKISESKKNKSN